MVEVGETGPTIENFHLANTSQSQAFEVPLTKNNQAMIRLYSSQSTDADRAELEEKSSQNETDSVWSRSQTQTAENTPVKVSNTRSNSSALSVRKAALDAGNLHLLHLSYFKVLAQWI